MSAGRDSQRAKVYAAEATWLGPRRLVAEMGTNAEVLAFAEKLAGRAVIRRNLPELGRYPLRVPRPNMGQRRALYHGVVAHDGETFAHEMSFPVWSRSRWVVAHELAHAATWNQGVPHGWEFAAAYLRLVRVGIGPEAEAELRAAFREHRVKFRAPVKRRPMSDEQKVAAAARLAEYRAARVAS